MTNKNMYAPMNAIDEALWAAYRRDDKATVMDYLFRRRLDGIGCSRSFHPLAVRDSSKKDRDARRAHAEWMLINDGARQPLRPMLN